ncbi:MAG: FliM/FliN family flagellar motor C-terminal domain-containing protein, partial [Phycisphaerales bacterium]|nr:FliM/FliN family flagellar motor C-terminal domain-containing protein [Phycisphaerales bacterium]
MPSDVRAILALEVPIIVQLGERNMRVADVCTWAPGSIIELNAATSEATTIYDPSPSFRWAQRTLRAQWSHLMTLASA